MIYSSAVSGWLSGALYGGLGISGNRPLCGCCQCWGVQGLMAQQTWAPGRYADLSGIANSPEFAERARRRREMEAGVFVWDDVQ
jgi:hypothetical protein